MELDSQPQLNRSVCLRFLGDEYKVDDFIYFDSNQTARASDPSSSESMLGSSAPSPSSRLLEIGKIRSISSSNSMELREYEHVGTEVCVLL